MNRKVLLGRGKNFLETSQQELEHHLALVPEHGKRRLSFMTQDHHRVRDYCVTQLARAGRPLMPETIANDLGISTSGVNELLTDLEKNLFFLVRNENNAVSWAFPITSDGTPHRLVFNTGEKVYGA